MFFYYTGNCLVVSEIWLQINHLAEILILKSRLFNQEKLCPFFPIDTDTIYFLIQLKTHLPNKTIKNLPVDSLDTNSSWYSLPQLSSSRP